MDIIEREIFALICRNDGIKAKEIVAKLNKDRKVINHYLYSSPYMHDMPYLFVKSKKFSDLTYLRNSFRFCVTKDQVQKHGNVWKNMKKNIDDFNETFNCLADRIIKATK